MESDLDKSLKLAVRLQQAGLGELTAWLLEAAAPLAPLAAQLGYLASPLLGSSRDEVEQLARLLDDPAQVSALADRLRQEGG